MMTTTPYDFFPFYNSNNSVPVNQPISAGEGFYLPGTPGSGAGDAYDSAGALQLPVERIRRYTTPIDPAGVGRVVAWNQRPINSYDYGLGADKWGRSAFFRYFRPAGVPKVVTYDQTTPLAPPYDNYNQPIMQGPAVAASPTGEWIFDIMNNRFHGFMSQVAPIAGVGLSGSVGDAAGIAVSGAMPWDWTTNGTVSESAAAFAGAGTLPPFPRIVLTGSGDLSHQPSSGTMTNLINTGQGPLLPPTDVSYALTSPKLSNTGATVVNSYPTYPPAGVGANVQGAGSSLNKDEADEMNLYTPNIFDAPFGPSDLEWLYRVQDVDGASLDSRLKQLAPISFLNPADGATRRRLFSTDSWELISPSYAPDQPSPLNYLQPVPGAAAGVTFTQDQDFSWNSRFNTYVNPSAGVYVTSNASLVGMNYNLNPSTNNYPINQNVNALTEFPNPVSFPQPIPHVPLIASFPYTMTAGTNSQLTPVITPTVAHRNRKINLNYPLPISNDPAEPVRQKWIRETYELFKAILPPQSIDTPEELAQLSQFVVNIIDFRDPDCSTTRFVNTDLMVSPATTVNPAKVVFSNIAVPTVATGNYPLGHFAYDPTIYDEQKIYPATGRDAVWQSNTTTATPAAAGDFLVQHGMEYNPLAINEVLATTYKLKSSSSTPVPFTRFAVEVINTITDDGVDPNPLTTSTSDLDAAALDGWDWIITADNGTVISPSLATGRPDPITGDVPPSVLADAITAHRQMIIVNTIPVPAQPNTFKLLTPAGVASTPIFGLQKLGPRTGGSNAYYQFGTPLPTGVTITPGGSNSESPPFPVSDAVFPSVASGFAPPSVSGKTTWCWVYLRRPANPFDTRPYAQREMVVVDSMRFPHADGNGVGKVGTPDTATIGTEKHFSASRLQPYRGGHSVPNLPGGVAVSPPYAWGYSEQTAIPSGAGMNAQFGTATSPYIAQPIRHNFSAPSTIKDLNWDSFPFHDRDFMSPAELLLVPGCSPGLFTKQFVYENDSTLARFNSVLDGNVTTDPTEPAPPMTTVTAGTLSGAGTNSQFDAKTPRTYPYLIDEFFYTGASVAPFTNPPTAALPYPSRIGGITGDGWHKILEFVEVPSSANGAIGTVAAGSNFDWFRQDVKPGLINLNLIIDEEVFFGVFDDPRLNKNLVMTPGATGPLSPFPVIVTQIDQYGYPSWQTVAGVTTFTGAYAMSNRGYAIVDPISGAELGTGMKAAFSDFLKLRSGGSGYLFAWGAGMVGSGPFSPATASTALVQSPVAQERPFRSLSYPDINYTVMRPAMLPPSPITNLAATPIIRPLPNGPYQYGDNLGNSFLDQAGVVVTAPAVGTSFVGDPGVRNPFLTIPATIPPPSGAYNQRQIPLVPLRRLFQIPDFANGVANPPIPPGSNPKPSAAAEYPYVLGVPTPSYSINQPITHPQLSDNSQLGPNIFGANTTNVQSANLFLDFQIDLAPGAAPTTPLTTTNAALINQYLGANLTSIPAPATTDNRQAPYFRTEMLQKVMNLTTVRTHQFAVWITVGFFEVLKTGSPALGIPDILGGELGLYAGKNVRYRSFFLVDRTRAVGFNSQSPQDFRDLVTYRRRIE